MRLTHRRASPLDAQPQTVGEHIKRARLTKRLTQAEAGEAIGVGEGTVLKWELNRCEPPVPLMPAVIRFIGRDPCQEPVGYPARLLAKRRVTGWSIKQAAVAIDINEATWALWERGVTVPRGGWLNKLEILLAQ